MAYSTPLAISQTNQLYHYLFNHLSTQLTIAQLASFRTRSSLTSFLTAQTKLSLRSCINSIKQHTQPLLPKLEGVNVAGGGSWGGCGMWEAGEGEDT